MKILSKDAFVSIGISILIVTPLALYLACAGNVKAVSEFDHSQCQYPYRVSNPIDGCDNSDPACPLEIKGGSCENYQPTEKELEPWKPEPAPIVPEPVVTPIAEKTKTCVEWR